MRKLFASLLTFVLALAPASAGQMSLLGAGKTGAVASACAPVACPGDIAGYSGAYIYVGLRCYTFAYAGAVADIQDTATGTVITNLVCSGGVVIENTNSLATTCAVACRATKLYDQSGNGRDMTNVTGSNTPVILSGVGHSKPVLQITSGSFVMHTTANAPAQAQPMTASLQVRFNTFTGIGGVLSDSTFNAMFLWNNAAASVRQSFPTDQTYTGVADNSWGSYQSVVNGASSTMNAANTTTNPTGVPSSALNPGATGIAGGTKLALGAMTDGPSVNMDGYVREAFIVTSAVSAPNQATMVANQRADGGY